MPSLPSQIRCREIQPDDISGIVSLLYRGFPERKRGHWVRTLERLAAHSTPSGYPKFGYMLESDGSPVGVLLLIFSAMPTDRESRIRANVASWYVDPAYRSHATMLTARALARKNVTFLNISPAPHTWPILEAQGFIRLFAGHFAAIPVLRAGPPDTCVTEVSAEACPGDGLSSGAITLLLHHASYGCISVICTAANRRYPFVFARCSYDVKSVRALGFSISLPYALLVYCHDLEDFVRFAGPLSRFLIRRGMPILLVESNGPISGVPGKFLASPKYCRGPHPPRIGDIAYTERAMFGL